MTIDSLITKLEVEVFKRKYGPAQHAELVAVLERECAVADVRAVVQDYLWHHVPGRPIPTPHEVRIRCLEEKRSRVRRAEDALRGKATASDVLEEFQAQSYSHRVYQKAFFLLAKSRRLQQLEQHASAVREAIRQIGEPRPEDPVREVRCLEKSSERLKHLARTVNTLIAEMDYDPFAGVEA